MKTINQFVDEFNEKYGEIGDVEEPLKVEETNRKLTLSLGYDEIIDLRNDGSWDIKAHLGEIKPIYQKYIMDYVYNSEPKDWFGDDEDDEIVVDGIQMTKKEADQLYEYFTKKQQEELYKELKKINGDFNKITKLLND